MTGKGEFQGWMFTTSKSPLPQLGTRAVTNGTCGYFARGQRELKHAVLEDQLQRISISTWGII